MRRESLWLGSTEVDSTLVGASSAILINVLNAAALALRPFTVVRFRGHMHLRSDQQVASEGYEAAWAQCVVSDQASAIGVTAVPTPVTDKGSDLFYFYEEMFGRFVFGDATGFSPVGGLNKDVDSRSMRKVDEGEDLIGVVESGLGNSGCRLVTAARILIKLH